MAKRKPLVFNKEFYNMLDAEDKKHYMSQDPVITQSFKLIKPWNDRNTRNADTKLSKEKPLRARKPLPRTPLSPDNKRKKLRKNIGYEKGSMTPEEAKYYSKVGY